MHTKSSLPTHPLEKQCNLAEYYLLYFQMMFPISEYILFLEVLYLNKIITVKKIC